MLILFVKNGSVARIVLGQYAGGYMLQVPIWGLRCLMFRYLPSPKELIEIRYFKLLTPSSD